MSKSNKITHILKAVNENTNLFSVLKTHFPTINVARLKLISLFITTLCKAQIVNYEKLALGFEIRVVKDSDSCRIQRFLPRIF